MKRTVHYLAILLVAALLGMWGCPKKTEVSSAPEANAEAAKQAQSDEAAKAEAARKAEAAKAAEAEKAAEAAKEAEAAREQSAATVSSVHPVYFDYDQSSIRDDQRETLRANAAWLKEHGKAKIKIEGNCDERGTIEYNQALGQRRAASAKKYLTTLGISARRISLVSYGKEKPVCTESNESCWQKNRRDDFVVTGE